MTVSRRLRTAVATTVSATALAFVAGVVSSTPADAADLCYAAGVSGSITGTHEILPRACVGSTLPALCTTPATSVGTLIGVHAEACVPD